MKLVTKVIERFFPLKACELEVDNSHGLDIYGSKKKAS